MDIKEKILNPIKKIFRINHKVVKGEIEEIKNLKVSDEDKVQGKAIATLAVAALASCGIPLGAMGHSVLEKVLAYAIRDMKDGISTPDKLIIARVVKEFKEEINPPKETIDALYENLNKK